ncbi:MAG: Do family serine endopeptidase [Spirochaetia bacterium]|nr:Do family serine endopeptidase [Spirochaetia bacterium]
MKKFLIIGLVLILITGSLMAMGIQDKNQNNVTNTEPVAVERVIPQNAGQVMFSFSGITKKVLPVVVEIDTVEVVKQKINNFFTFNPFDFFFGGNPGTEGGKGNQPKERQFERPGLGSGIIINQTDDTVYVLTNCHVAGKADQITVKLYDGKEFEAAKIGEDSRMDLALISFKCAEKVPVASFGDSDALEVGDIVLAVGTPYGFESTVTAGIVSGLGRKSNPASGGNISTFTDYIQTDASINPGNSGGALVNMLGEVVGINTWIATQSGGSVGLGFAIPSNTAKRIATDFMTKGKVEYGWLGVSIDSIDDSRYPGMAQNLGIEGKSGAMVFNVFKNSPADKAGILPGDYVIKVNGTDITDSNHLTKTIATIPPKERVSFSVIRDKKEKVLSVVLETREDEDKVQSNRDIWPGFIVLDLNEKLCQQFDIDAKTKGVVIAGVSDGTAASKANFQVGDIIQEINDRAITNVGEFYTALNDNRTSKKMFQISRGGQSILVGLIK